MSKNCIQVLTGRKLRDKHGEVVAGLRRIILEPSIAFPKELLKPDIRGGAQIAFHVSEDGSVVDARVVSATHEEYGAAVLDNVTSWKFEQLSARDAPYPTEMQSYFSFRTR